MYIELKYIHVIIKWLYKTCIFVYIFNKYKYKYYIIYKIYKYK